MNKKLLRGLMALHGDTNKSLAKFLGISEQSVCNKINEKGTEFNRTEIGNISNKYSMTPELVDLVFFAEKVSNSDT